MMAYLILPLAMALLSCASKRQVSDVVDTTPKWTPDTRVAQAQINSGEISQIQGQVFFEQMPNSVIVMYHIEGLQPKNRYQIFLHQNQSCSTLNTERAEPLAKVRARSDGIAEHTFKTENLSVTKGDRALVGDSIVIRWLDEDLGSFSPAIACAEVRPQNSSDLAAQ